MNEHVKKSSHDSVDPFAGVDAKTISEVENEHGVEVDREPLPAAAQLTNLPLKWLLLMLFLCLGANLMIDKVERSQLIAVAEQEGIIDSSEAEDARSADKIVAQREKVRDRLRQLKERREEFQRLQEEADSGMNTAQSPDSEEHTHEMPLTLESARAELVYHAGDQFPDYQRVVTIVALVIGGLGLIVMALFVRVLGASVLGGAAFAATWIAGLAPEITWGAAVVGALLGLALAPRLLLANMIINTTLALLVIGAVLVGGGAYLYTQDSLYSVFGLGVGAVVGAIFGLRYSRQLFLSAVLANCAGAATLALWLMWGELFTNFWPLTFGALMIFDGVATRIYHKIRWGRH